LLKQQSSIIVHRLPTKENELSFSVSVSSKQTEVFRFCFPFAENKQKLYMYMLPFLTENGKRKPRRFSITCLPIAYRANASLSFVRLLTKKKQNGSFPFANGLNGFAHP
jgi:hypothetical protein